MTAALIIVEPPGFDDVLGLGHRGKLVYVQTFIAQSAVKRFKMLLRLTPVGLVMISILPMPRRQTGL